MKYSLSRFYITMYNGYAAEEEILPLEREDAREPGSLAFIMKKLFSKQ